MRMRARTRSVVALVVVSAGCSSSGGGDPGAGITDAAGQSDTLVVDSPAEVASDSGAPDGGAPDTAPFVPLLDTALAGHCPSGKPPGNGVSPGSDLHKFTLKD